MTAIVCTNCRNPYPEKGVPYRCSSCGGIFDYQAPLTFDPSRVNQELPGIWRYRNSFGLQDEAPATSLGEGQTPLIWGKAFGRQVAFKCEFQNPTGSFKDRGSAVLTSFLCSRGVTRLVEDSSGNAGASLAAYAARANIAARIFVPDVASGPKRAQIEAYGAEVVRIMGPRSNAAEAVRRAVDPEDDARDARAAVEGQAEANQVLPTYASHAYLPFNLPGYATLAYELYEQLSGAPGVVMLPVGQGGLLLGIGRGFIALQHAGLIDKVPMLIGVQARACAPLWAVASYGAAGLGWVAEADTLAEGIRVAKPVRGDEVLQMVTSVGGTFLAVDEEEILPGRHALARHGFYVEPTSAVVWGALSQAAGDIPEPLVVVLTGSGLKSMH